VGVLQGWFYPKNLGYMVLGVWGLAPKKNFEHHAF